MSNSVQQTRELVSGAITMIDKAVNNELSLSAQFCVGCLLSVKEALAKALAIPLRECDVGTAEEQAKRFQEFCDDSQTDEDFCSMCARCSLKKERHCEIVWAQMPYTESVVGE